MVNKKSWEEFRTAGMLWFINTILHAFGWAIVIEIKDGNTTEVYPARVKFRGFSTDCNTAGYVMLSQYLKDNAEVLCKEAQE